ncbi:hypothetical protein AZE99_01550 [Sphingorhabdus sp. M41]|nr:hypothetical protein AZE99_01550 [Sphingorhabdus sp. M41]
MPADQLASAIMVGWWRYKIAKCMVAIRPVPQKVPENERVDRTSIAQDIAAFVRTKRSMLNRPAENCVRMHVEHSPYLSLNKAFF